MATRLGSTQDIPRQDIQEGEDRNFAGARHGPRSRDFAIRSRSSNAVALREINFEVRTSASPRPTRRMRRSDSKS